MKTNIFIVRTPLQAFNAIEAKERFCRDDHNHIIIVYRNDSDKRLIEKILVPKQWTNILYQQIKPHRELFFLFRHLLKQFPIINFCFIGDHSTLINYYMNRVKYEKLILLDDGTATIRIADLLEKKVFHKIKKTAYSEKKYFELLFEKLFKIDTKYYYNSTLFSIYDLKNNIDIINNDYRFFQKNIETLPKKRVVFFIGSNIKDKILINEKLFEKHLANIVSIYKKRNIELYYILHRKEDQEYMSDLSKKLDFKSIKFDNIIELEILNLGYVPIEIATFLSTAITTLKCLYNSEYNYYNLDKEDVNNKYQKVLADLYIEFQKENIKRLN